MTNSANTTASIPTPSAIGRPRALDEVKLGQICSLVSAGCGLEKAARYVGCAASTIRREARRNRNFGQQLRRAGMEAELEAYRAMRRAAGTHWRAAAWLLERSDIVAAVREQNRTQRIKPRKAHPVEPGELERFASAVQRMVVRTVTDNALLYELHNQVNNLLAAARPKSPTAGQDARTTDATGNNNQIDMEASETLPSLTTDCEENFSPSEQQ